MAPAAARAARARLTGLPRALWVCVAVAVANAASWAVITPVFQVPDELVHVGYAQYMGETGRVPSNISPYFKPSQELEETYKAVPFSVLGSPTWAAADDRALDRALARPLDRVSEQGAGYAANNPPLYYAAAGMVYKAAATSGGSLLDRIFAMRLLSALFAGLTVGFVFMFLRELLAGPPWVWTVGALAAALNPLFAFLSGGVNPDALLYTMAAAIMWLLARGFRRGLTPRLGIALGLAMATGVVTKGTTFAFVPGVALGVAILVWRSRHGDRRSALVGAAGVAAGVLLPVAVWLVANTLLLERTASTTTSSFSVSTTMSLRGFLSYLWQFYLPRMPGMQDWFSAGFYPLWDTYFQGMVGRFGWFQWGFPLGVSWVALVALVSLVALALRGLLSSPRAVRARAGELAAYATLTAGLLMLIAVLGYRYLVLTGFTFEQARYLLPLLPLYAGLIAFAVRSAGPKVAVPLGALVVVVAAGHNIFAQLLSIARYYT